MSLLAGLRVDRALQFKAPPQQFAAFLGRDLPAVPQGHQGRTLELRIVPDIGGGSACASLKSWRLA
jgi:hypothetical protein